jgi:hypothetical protein
MIRSEPFAASEDRCVLILCEKKHLHAHTLVGGTSFSDVQCRVPVSLSELQSVESDKRDPASWKVWGRPEEAAGSEVGARG